jgi:hypothetical protein
MDLNFESFSREKEEKRQVLGSAQLMLATSDLGDDVFWAAGTSGEAPSLFSCFLTEPYSHLI